MKKHIGLLIFYALALLWNNHSFATMKISNVEISPSAISFNIDGNLLNYETADDPSSVYVYILGRGLIGSGLTPTITSGRIFDNKTQLSALTKWASITSWGENKFYFATKIDFNEDLHDAVSNNNNVEIFLPFELTSLDSNVVRYSIEWGQDESNQNIIGDGSVVLHNVPEPSSCILLSIGALGLIGARRRGKSAADLHKTLAQHDCLRFRGDTLGPL